MIEWKRFTAMAADVLYNLLRQHARLRRPDLVKHLLGTGVARLPLN